MGFPHARAGATFHEQSMQRGVERGDQDADADGLTEDHVEPGVLDRDDLSEEFVRRSRVVLERVGGALDFRPGVGDRLPDVASFELCQRLDPLQQQLGDLGQHAAARRRRPVAPFAVLPGADRGSQRDVHVLAGRFGNPGDNLSGRRLVDGHPGLAPAIDRPASDQKLVIHNDPSRPVR